MTIVVVHAYSRTNSGDGLLVDLTISRLSRIFPGEDVVVYAQDPGSFLEYDSRLWTSRLGSLPESSFVASTVGARVVGPSTSVAQELRTAGLIVGVGGGYLRGSTCLEWAKSEVAHFAQLQSVGEAGVGSVYLPQSIGPYPRVVSEHVRRALNKIDHVFVRDDKSRAFLRGLQNVSRVPDLAVLALADARLEPKCGSFRKPIAVARDIHRAGSYNNLLEEMSISGRFEWALQATGRGNDDSRLSSRLASGPTCPLSLLLDTNSAPRVVVSTRLHGSLQALLRGFPTVHLGYERKSWGAFEDLGIPEYVLNCRRSSLYDVVEKIEAIERDPQDYWSRVSANLDRLKVRSRYLDELIAGAAGPNIRIG
ncbi:polysaccharide pyruvyl transferase family protein [Gordonia sp. DT218]|uniref:polysaccharide pyruvyl transferase family protein n=1 Tax=Gordonia sp. DT218 TaxID=3416659 RepID=UPI003CEC84D4